MKEQITPPENDHQFVVGSILSGLANAVDRSVAIQSQIDDLKVRNDRIREYAESLGLSPDILTTTERARALLQG